MPYRFIVITDTHFIAPGHRMVGRTWWNRVLEARCDELSAALRQAVDVLKPDFVVHCGDFVDHGDLASCELGFQMMDRLGCPWYAVPGNHDTWLPGMRTALATRYQLPGERCFYTRDLAGLRFIFLDVVYWGTGSGEMLSYLDQELADRGQIRGMGPSPEELVWLEGELAAADRPVVLISHAPLGYRPTYPIQTLPYGTPARQPQTSVAELMGDVLHRNTLRELVRRYPRVKIMFSGHWHLCDMVREEGVTYCQTGALREFPFEFRVVEVEGQMMRVATAGLGDNFQRESYIEAWGNRWIAGSEAARSFQVELK
jgi:Calcineurin-like phosphoesterase